MPYPPDPFPKNQLAGPRYTEFIKQLETNYRQPPAKPPGPPQLPKFLRTPIPGGGVVGGAFVSVLADLLFPEPTADEDEILKRIREPIKELSPPPFTGGQDCNVLYQVWFDTSFDNGQTWNIATSRTSSFRGRVGGISREQPTSTNYRWKLTYYSCAGVEDIIYLASSGTPDYLMRINRIDRVDGLPDNSGNPPSEYTSAPGGYSSNPNRLKRNYGDKTPPAPYTPPNNFYIPSPPSPFTPDYPGEINFAPADNDGYFPGANPSPPDTIKPPAPNPGPAPTTNAPPPAPYFISPPDNKPTDPYFDVPPAFKPTSIPPPSPFMPTPVGNTTFTGGGQIISNKFAPDTNTRNPVPVLNPPAPTPPITPPPTKSDTEKIIDLLEDLIINNPVLAGTGIVAIKQIVDGIASNTTPEALRNAAADGTCQTTQPGGCTSNLIDNAVGNVNQNTNNKLDLLGAGNTAANAEQLRQLGIINTKLGDQVTGGISGFLTTAFRATRLDKIINALTLITVLHNAAMLSRNLASTLGDLTSQALAVIGIKDENDSPLDINAEIGRQVNNLMSTILGAEVWAGTKLAWNKANAVIASASQIVFTVRSLWDSSREVLEWTAENTGRIGNALKKFRIVGENAYRWMPEQVTHQNAWALKIQRYRDGIDNLDDAASSLQGVLGEVQNIQEEFKELNEQKEKFDKNVADLTPKNRPDNKPVADAVTAARIASKAPADAANVSRGEGEKPDA